MRKRIKLEHPLPKDRSLSERDIPEIAEDVRRAFEQDAVLSDFSELEKSLPSRQGPNYGATVFYRYSLSTSS